jgi:PmbA protein
MRVELFAEKLFAAGKEAGFTDMEVYFQSGSQFRVGIFKREIDSYSLAEDAGLSFRGLYNGKMGYAYTEKLDESSLQMLINDARENAQLVDSDEVAEIFAGSESYAQLEGHNPRLDAIQAEEKIALAKALEEKAYALDQRVFNVQAFFGDGAGERRIINSKGLNLVYRGNSAMAGLSVVARQEREAKTAHEMEQIEDLAQFDVDEIARKAVDEAVSLFGADTVPSGEYPIILRRDVASQMLGVLTASFSAENVQKGMSLLKDRIGQQVFSEKITIIDDPLMPGRPASCPFDAEGVATRTKQMVENGKLMTYLHNLKTARIDGVESTGNASKRSYKSPLGIAPSNFYIAAGEKSYDEIIAGTEEGIIVISVAGLHSGANPVSGDFSLGAYGYLVQGGKVVRPVNQITIAGNFFRMLNDVLEVGNDLKFGRGSIVSPTLKIARLSVAGK